MKGEKILKKTVSLLAVLCLLASVFALPAYAAAEPKFYCKDLSGKLGDTITVTVGVEGTYKDVGGLNISLEFNADQLSFIDGSRKLLCSTMKKDDFNADSSASGRVSLLYTSYDGGTVSGDIVSYRFKVIKSTESLKIKVKEMFKNDASFTNILSKAVVLDPGPDIMDNGAVKDVTEKIAAIGTVTLTDECKQKIDAARAAYNKLTYGEKQAVTNYAVLTAAEIRYNALKAGENEAVEEAQRFKTENSEILSKTADTVTIADEEKISNALAAWSVLSPDAKIRVVNEKNLLNSLKTKVEDLKKTEEEQKALLKEAQDFLNEFKSNYGNLLKIKYEDIEANYYEAFYTALNELKNYEDMNSKFSEVAANEIALVTKYYKRALELKAKEDEIKDPYKDEAEAFQTKYGWILGMKPEDATLDDLPDIAVAAYAYSLLSDGAKKLLPNAETHLSALMTAAENAVSDQEKEIETVTVDRIIEKTVEKPSADNSGTDASNQQKGKVSVMLNALVPGLSPVVWWLLGSGLLLIILNSVFYVLYLKTRSEKR